MITLEHSLIISSIAISVTYCFVTICRQVQHSKCTHIQFCCCSIERDISNSESESDPEPILPINPSINAIIDSITPHQSRQTTPIPKLARPKLPQSLPSPPIASSQLSSPTQSLITATVQKLSTSKTQSPEEIV